MKTSSNPAILIGYKLPWDIRGLHAAISELKDVKVIKNFTIFLDSTSYKNLLQQDRYEYQDCSFIVFIDPKESIEFNAELLEKITGTTNFRFYLTTSKGLKSFPDLKQSNSLYSYFEETSLLLKQIDEDKHKLFETAEVKIIQEFKKDGTELKVNKHINQY